MTSPTAAGRAPDPSDYVHGQAAIAERLTDLAEGRRQFNRDHARDLVAAIRQSGDAEAVQIGIRGHSQTTSVLTSLLEGIARGTHPGLAEVIDFPVRSEPVQLRPVGPNVVDAETLIADLEDEVAGLRERIVELEGVVVSKDEEIVRLRARLADTTRLLAEASADLADA